MPVRRGLRLTGASALLAGLLLTGCGQGGSAVPAASPAAPTPTSLADTKWLAEKLGSSAVASGTAITAAFGADGSLAGTGGCNRYRTTFTTTGSTIKIAETVASTMMACDEAVMKQETAFFSALTGARTFSVASGKLTLSDGAGAALVVFKKGSQDLTGSWLVTGYNNGNAAVVSPVAGSTPALQFADGKVAGTGGCNRLGGDVKVDGNKITMGPLVSTMMACDKPDGVMKQESALMAALASAATFTIEGDRLEFRSADGAIAVTLTRG